MSLPITLAAFSTLVVAIPAFAFRRRFLLNPAFYVLIIVSGSVLLKTLYVSLVRHQPLPVGHDAIYIDAASPDFLIPGAWLALVAAVAYTGGFLMIGSRTLAPWMPFRLRETALPRSAPRNVLVLTGLSIGAFVLYLVASDTSFFQLPFSAKRFAPENIDVSSRFEYAPYYLFKIALTGGSIACVAALALFRSRDPVYRGLFALVFLFALTLSHFASLRLFILLVILQVVLLLIHFRAHRELRFVSLFVFLTAGSFLLITVIDRAPPREAMEMVQRAVTDPDVPAGPEEAGPIAADDIVDRPVPATSAPTPRPARAELDEADDPKPVVGLAARLASAGFEGRYFMDVSKLAHIARHFPARETLVPLAPGLPSGRTRRPGARRETRCDPDGAARAGRARREPRPTDAIASGSPGRGGQTDDSGIR